MDQAEYYRVKLARPSVQAEAESLAFDLTTRVGGDKKNKQHTRSR